MSLLEIELTGLVGFVATRRGIGQEPGLVGSFGPIFLKTRKHRSIT